MNLLLTAFEPFGGDDLNPSLLIARALDGEVIGGARVRAVQLPCVFGRAIEALDRAIDQTQPVAAVSLGLAAGRSGLWVERVAINVDDARIPDNAGAQPVDAAIDPAGPAAWFSTLPIKAIVAAIRGAGLEAGVSQTAGTFVCNHVFYGLQRRLAGSGVRSGFIHVPLMPEQVHRYPGAPTLPLQDMVDGVRIALQVTLAHRGDDLRLAAGQIA